VVHRFTPVLEGEARMVTAHVRVLMPVTTPVFQKRKGKMSKVLTDSFPVHVLINLAMSFYSYDIVEKRQDSIDVDE